MTKQSIPQHVKEQVDAIVERFNHEVIQDDDYFFAPRYRERFLYLDRRDGDRHWASARGRLTYTGDMHDWHFAIYKYSSERYDPDEWMFPGSQHINGTVEGALKACLEAYP
jgi:hypothetical protein